MDVRRDVAPHALAVAPWFTPSQRDATRLLAAGALMGVLGGLAAVLFDHAMSEVGRLVLGTATPAHAPPSVLRAVLGPTLLALAAGLLVKRLTRRGRPQGTADVLARVQLGEPTLSLRDGLVSAGAAALAVGGGVSGGREGPIIQVASSLAARACHLLGLPPASVPALVAAGAAAGIAASFDTPLGGAFFALEILLGDFAVAAFAPVVVATVTGTVLGQALLGDRVALELPPLDLGGPWALPLFLLAGVVAALVAHGFKGAVVFGAHRLLPEAAPAWLRAGGSGAVVGLVAVAGHPQVMGNGYAFMEDLLAGRHPGFLFLVTLLVAKVGATAVTVAGRTGAGLFAPSLFVGAVAGALFGELVAWVAPGFAPTVGAFGVVGMGVAAAAVLGAPLTMALMLFEMTGSYAIVLPLLLALGGGGLVSVVLRARSLEELELDQQGLSRPARRERRVLEGLRVRDVYRTDGFEVMPPNLPVAAIVERFLQRRVQEILVVDDAGRYLGSVLLQDVKEALAGASGTARPRLHRVPPAPLDGAVADVLSRFFDAPADELPVVDVHGVLVGVLVQRDVVAAYQREVLRDQARVARVVHHDADGAHDDFLELPEGQAMAALPVGGAEGATLRELALPRALGVTVVAMSLWDEPSGTWRRVAVDAARRLDGRDKLVVVGPAEVLRRWAELGTPTPATPDSTPAAPGEG